MSGPQRPLLGRVAAALVGLLAVAAALAAGHLVAGILLESSASPYLAVGNAVIDRTPKPVTDFAIEVFGTNDKLVLLLGMAVAIALTGVVAGLVSRRQPFPGLVVIVVLGAVGILAVLEQTPGALVVLAPIASLLVGLAAFWWLHTLGQRRAWTREPMLAGPQAPQDAPPGRAHNALARRKFLVGSTGVAAGAAAAGIGGSLLGGRVDVQGSRAAVGDLTPAVPAPPIPPGADFAELGTPTFITPNADFYRIDINLQVPQLRAQEATLRIIGMVDREVELSFEDIRRRDLVEKTITMACVSNIAGGYLVSTSNFVGVPLRELLMEAGVQDGATQLVGRASDGFTIGTPLNWVLPPEREALLRSE